MLTPAARHAFDGPAPLFLVDSNTRGCGKSLLADTEAVIVTGRLIPRTSWPQCDSEVRKRITAIVLAGDQMALFDNVAGELGGAALDAALTGSVWKDRILGHSKMVQAPLTVTWLATGNNVVLGPDTSRRTCHIRLETDLENPEERKDFRHPKLLKWVRSERPRLLSASLTVLSGFCRAGRPDQGLKAWGSFEAWSDLVRQTVVWIGMPDPGETRSALASSSDCEANAMRALLHAWPEIDPGIDGLTAARLLERLRDSPGKYDELRGAVLELCPGTSGELPGVRSLGNKFRHLKGRVVAGRALDSRDEHGTAVWFTRQTS